MRVLLPLLLMALLAGCGGPGAARIEPYEPEVEPEFLVLLPDDYEPGEHYPLVVALHGYDRSESQPAVLRDAGFFFMPDFILLAVRAPFEAGIGYSWFRWPDEREDGDVAAGRRRSASTAEEAVLAALVELEEQYRVDADHRVLLGLGQGATAAAWTALRNQDLFSGLALFGAVDLELAAFAGASGADDLEVFAAGPAGATHAIEQYLSEAGAGVRRYELPGPAVSAAALRAMQNFFDIAEEAAPEDDLGYDEDGEPVPGERLHPADWGDEPGPDPVDPEEPDAQ